MNRHQIFYFDNPITTNFCGNEVITVDGGMYEKPFDIIRIEGEHKLKSCKKCSKMYNSLIIKLQPRANKFPFCCESHKKLVSLHEFKPSDFSNQEKAIAYKIMTLYHHIINHLDKDDWHEDITNYIEYVIESLGTFPNGYGGAFMSLEFWQYTIDLLRGCVDSKSVTLEEKRKVKILINYINSRFDNNTDIEKTSKDFNLLLSIYDRWFSVFPFELSYFKDLKETFKKKIPITKGGPKFNKYTNRNSYALHTKSSLLESLNEITNQVIKSVNGLVLYQNEQLKDADAIKLELILEKRKLELSEVDFKDDLDGKRYVKILKKWLTSEKEFISEIKPFLTLVEENKKANNSRPNRTDIAYYIHYLEQTKSLELDNKLPSEKAWAEIGNKFSKNAKNIQQAYNKIMNKEERLKKTKKSNVNYVIKNMLNEYPNALKLAKDELNLIELNS